MVVTEVASQFGSFVTYRKITVGLADFQASSGAGPIVINLSGVGGVTSTNALSAVNSGNLVIPQGYYLLGVRLIQTAQVSGGGLTAVTASLGISGGSGTGILAAQDVHGATAGTVVVVAATAIATLNGTLGLAAWTPNITFTTTTANLSAATAGQVDVEFIYLNVSTPSV